MINNNSLCWTKLCPAEDQSSEVCRMGEPKSLRRIPTICLLSSCERESGKKLRRLFAGRGFSPEIGPLSWLGVCSQGQRALLSDSEGQRGGWVRFSKSVRCSLRPKDGCPVPGKELPGFEDRRRCADLRR